MKKHIAGLILFSGLILILGAEGGAVRETLTMGQFFGLALVGLAMMGAAAWLLKG